MNLVRLTLMSMMLLFYSCIIKDGYKDITGGGSTSSSSSALLSGSISPFSGLIAHKSHPLNPFSSAWAATCAGVVEAKLYLLDSNGQATGSALATSSVGSDAAYSFDFTSLGITVGSKVTHVVEVTGCTEVLSLPVTGTGSNNIDYTTTLMSFSGGTINLKNVDTSSLKTFMGNVSGATLTGVYNNINGDAGLSASFLSVFGQAHTKILNAPPKLNSVTIPTTIAEGTLSAFQASAFHFAGGYDLKYRWVLDGSTVSNAATWNWTPGKNQQGAHTVQLFMGQNNDGGDVDIAKDHLIKAFSVTVADTFPATSPTLSLTTPASSPVTVDNLTLNIATGAALVNCATFTSLAITENDATTPAAGAFTITCSTNTNQSLAHTLTDTSEGTKNFRLWAIDAAGNISSSASTLNIVKDTANPVSSLTTPTGPLKGGSTETISLAGTDTGGSGVAQIALHYASDGSTFALVTSGISTSATSYNWTVPSDDVVTAKLKVIVTDAGGNTHQTISSAFTIDSTGPGAPSSTMVNSAYTTAASATFTITSCADRSAIFVKSTAGAPLDSDAGWQTCATTAGAISYTLATETSYTLRVWAKDALGNVSATSTDHSVTKDNTSPAVSVTGPSATASSGQGNITITWTATDTNIATNPISLDYSANGGTSWTSIATGEANDGTYTWASPGFDGTSYRVRVTAIDQASLTTTSEQSSNWTMDSTDPAAVAASFVINGGSATTNTNFINAAFNVTDALTTATAFCLQENSTTPPSSGDSCWIPFSTISVTPSSNVAVTTYGHQLPFANGGYAVYLFIKDGVGNISDLTNTGAGTDGQDKDSVTYTPGNAPVVQDILATGADAPTNPPTSGEKTVTSGSDLYIKWNASDVEDADSTLTINLYYTTDDSTWTSIAAGLTNAQNGTCTVNHGSTTADDNATGCYKWTTGSPTSSYYRVKVEVADSASSLNYATSDSINVPFLRTIAGKTGDGIGASATSAVVGTGNPGITAPDVRSFVVRGDGTVYFRDISKGILKVDPITGILSVYIPYTGTYSGEGGAPTSATLNYVEGIVLDYNDDLYIRMTDRILKVDFTANTISTWIGGGSDYSDTIVTPTNLAFTAPPATAAYRSYVDHDPFFFTPNGDFYFASERILAFGTYDGAGGTSNNKSRIRKFVASSGQVASIDPGGTGIAGLPTQDLSKCSLFNFAVKFDLSTSAFTSAITMATGRPSLGGESATGCETNVLPAYTATLNPTTFQSLGSANAFTHPAVSTWWQWGSRFVQGMNGELYMLMRETSTVYQYNSSTKSFDIIIGTGSRGTCADGTAATSCTVDPWDLFVSSAGTIYLLDNGVIRTIDSSGNLQTIFFQSKFYGDGGVATNARLNQVQNIKLWRDGSTDKVVAYDVGEFRFREFAVDGNINTIVGNGDSYGKHSLGSSILGKHYAVSYGQPMPNFGLDSSGNLYLPINDYVVKTNRTSGLWESWLGNPTSGTTYSLADGTNDVDIESGYFPQFIGNNGTDFLVTKGTYNGTSFPDNTVLKTYNITTATQGHVAGIVGTSQYANLFNCANGAAYSTCDFATLSATLAMYWPWDSNNSRFIGAQNGKKDLYAVAAGGTKTVIASVAQNIHGLAYNTTADIIYYCSTDTGRIYQYNVGTTTETALNWPITSMACTRNNLIYNPNGDGGNGSLIFVYTLNNQQAIGEYLNP